MTSVAGPKTNVNLKKPTKCPKICNVNNNNKNSNNNNCKMQKEAAREGRQV